MSAVRCGAAKTHTNPCPEVRVDARAGVLPLAGVLLDVDGTLVDSNFAHARAWVDTFHEFGYDVPLQRALELVGMGSDNYIPAAIGIDGQSPEGAAIARRRDAVFRERYLQTVRPFPMVRPLLERMAVDGLALLTATSSNAQELQAALHIAGIDDLVSDAVPRNPAQRSKPAPDVVSAAIARSRASPSRLVLIGDTPYDIEAALQAGVRCIAFRCGGWPDDRLHGAAQIYDGPWDLLEHYEHFERVFM